MMVSRVLTSCDFDRMQPVIDRVRELWRELSGAHEAFTRRVVIIGSNDHRCSPPGWVGVVTIRGDSVVACPSDQLERVCEALDDVDGQQLAESRYVEELLRPDERLGPARLFYDDVQRSPLSEVMGPLRASDNRILSVLRDATDAERHESGLEDNSLGLYVAVDEAGRPAAVCGWHEWPNETAHVGVLAARSSRGSGHAKRAALQTLSAAADANLLAQWRAAVANEASNGLARSLGLTEVGSQFSVRLRS